MALLQLFNHILPEMTVHAMKRNILGACNDYESNIANNILELYMKYFNAQICIKRGKFSIADQIKNRTNQIDPSKKEILVKVGTAGHQ